MPVFVVMDDNTDKMRPTYHSEPNLVEPPAAVEKKEDGVVITAAAAVMLVAESEEDVDVDVQKDDGCVAFDMFIVLSVIVLYQYISVVADFFQLYCHENYETITPLAI